MPDRPPPTEENPIWPRVLASLDRERGARAWLRARPTPQRFAIVGAGLLLLVIAILLFAGRGDLASYPRAPLAAALALLLATSALLVRALLRPLGRREPSRRARVLLAGAALLLPLVLVVAAPGHEHATEPSDATAGAGAAFGSRAGACFGLGVASGGVVLLLVRLVDRRDRLDGSRLVALAALGGVVGNLLLWLHCPITAPAHLLLGHATVPLGFLVGALVAGRLKARP